MTDATVCTCCEFASEHDLGQLCPCCTIPAILLHNNIDSGQQSCTDGPPACSDSVDAFVSQGLILLLGTLGLHSASLTCQFFCTVSYNNCHTMLSRPSNGDITCMFAGTVFDRFKLCRLYCQSRVLFLLGDDEHIYVLVK